MVSTLSPIAAPRVNPAMKVVLADTKTDTKKSGQSPRE